MNCATYRRLTEGEPDLRTAALTNHLAGCPECALFTHKVRQFDKRLKTALNVPVPENLEAKILLRQSFQSKPARPGQPSMWALAASVLLVLSLAISGSWYYDNAQKSLQSDLLSVVNTARYAMDSVGPVSATQIAQAFEPIGLRLASLPGNVSFAGKCLVQGKIAGHMIVRQQGKPITLIFMPNRWRLTAADFDSQHWRGQLVPVASGTIAIIAPPDLALQPVRELIQNLVRWEKSV